MSLGLVGRKVGMTRIFADDGTAIPVTVLDVSNNRITQIKTPDTDGYSAVQVAYGTRRASRVAKAQAGHYAKAGVEAGSVLNEFTTTPEKLAELKVGSTLSVEMFAVGQKVDVSGTTLGKGFSGVIKRHHFSSNRASHSPGPASATRPDVPGGSGPVSWPCRPEPRRGSTPAAAPRPMLLPSEPPSTTPPL